jgi:hypothetical protein
MEVSFLACEQIGQAESQSEAAMLRLDPESLHDQGFKAARHPREARQAVEPGPAGKESL